MKTLKTSIIFIFLAISSTNCQDFTGYYLSINRLSTNKSILGLSVRFPIRGPSFYTRIGIFKDSTFQYECSSELSRDEAIGILKDNRRGFNLIYLTPSYSILSVSETKTIMTDPAIYVIYKVPFQWENPIACFRPIEIKCCRKKLFIIKSKESTIDSRPKKNKLKKVSYDEWIKYGPIVID
jgi:hypothetical protein